MHDSQMTREFLIRQQALAFSEEFGGSPHHWLQKIVASEALRKMFKEWQVNGLISKVECHSLRLNIENHLYKEVRQ